MKIIIIILQAILNLVRKRRDLIANRSKIPPEYRDDVVVWYSPKKQRLTNYDVIESYAEDFTYWTINNTSITSAQKKIVIPAGTELEYVIAYRGFNASTDGFDIKYTGNIAITYRYNKEDGTVGTIAIDKSGIYHLPASVRAQKNFGFYCNPQTTTEEATIEQLPTSILKDFSGNGLDAYMYGFQGKLNSGMGLYKVDFTSWRKSSVQTEVKPDIVKVTPNTSNYLFIQYANSVEIPSYKIKVIGLGDNVLKYQYATENGRKEINIVEGENELPTSIKVSNDYQIGYRLTPGTSVFTITQIPDYPNQLCYSGKETLIAYDIPLLTDFTVIAKRKWLNVNKGTFIVYGSPLSSGINGSAFGFELIDVSKTKLIYSFNKAKLLDNFYEKDISYMNSINYNGIDIVKGGISNTKNTLAVGNYTDNKQFGFIGCHDDIIILKRSLTIDEINDITEAIFNETIIEE
jgi:hypothetical protein|nr:MAG TPA: hypothetical protein [Crassvirales sp.]